MSSSASAGLQATSRAHDHRSAEARLQLGIDVGGTSIKGAIIDLGTGQLAGAIHTRQTPDAAAPLQVAALVEQIAAAEQWTGRVGVALPGVIAGSRLRHAPNLSGSWEHDGALDCLRTLKSTPTVLINDADAAGLAELTYGGSRNNSDGLTIVLTFGTGIGSALLHNGALISDTELGGIEHDAGRFEDIASGRAISDHNLTPDQWAARAQPFFDRLEALLNPSRWVLGGGLTENFHQYAFRLALSKPVSPAHLGIHAGIVGAAAAVGCFPSHVGIPGEQ
ncbi:ROK family protein [Candidatus Poriferisodalis sp.]|uniref:ROK family protein n=1 Tax=Candidatus Poriferisodalis sp. TaxID=3101277 RepID=UPI003B01AB35